MSTISAGLFSPLAIAGVTLRNRVVILLHSFLSPISNRRTDGYGGGLEGRMRFVLEVVADVRRVWPESKPLFVRISSVDADGSPEGWQLADSIVLAKALRQRGVDVVDCSSGGLSGLATAAIGVQPLGFRTPYARAIRHATDMLTMTVGLVLNPDQADAAVRSGSADLVGIGREALYDPFWALHAARELGEDPDFHGWPEPYGWWLVRRQALLRQIRQA
jgi:2,4-dienoyl-CoA reductase-like NADH-dependent reductase (Old Yellow Enzyme family)